MVGDSLESLLKDLLHSVEACKWAFYAKPAHDKEYKFILDVHSYDDELSELQYLDRLIE